MSKTETVGILANPDGFLWLIQFTTGHGVSVGIEEFEGKLVKVTRTNEKITIELMHELEAVPIPLRARELCRAGG